MTEVTRGPSAFFPKPGKKVEQILLESIFRNMKDGNTFANSKNNFPKAKHAQPSQLLIMMKPLSLQMKTEQQTPFTLALACFLTAVPLSTAAAKKTRTRRLVTRLKKKVTGLTR